MKITMCKVKQVLLKAIVMSMARCEMHEMDAPGLLVPITVDEDPSMPSITVSDTMFHPEDMKISNYDFTCLEFQSALWVGLSHSYFKTILRIIKTITYKTHNLSNVGSFVAPKTLIRSIFSLKHKKSYLHIIPGYDSIQMDEYDIC